MEAGKSAFTDTRGEVRFADGFVQGGTDADGVAKFQIRVANTATLNAGDFVWGKSRAGKNVVRLVTAKNRYARALAAVAAWCRFNRHHLKRWGRSKSSLQLAS
jgi:hypothetical protein